MNGHRFQSSQNNIVNLIDHDEAEPKSKEYIDSQKFPSEFVIRMKK